MKIKEVKKRFLILIIGILLIGVMTASVISLSNYIKVKEKTEVDTTLFCKEKVCDKKTPKTISLNNSNLRIDVLKDTKTNQEVLKIYSK